MLDLWYTARDFNGAALMIIHPNFSPVALSIGGVSIHWYGLMYLLAMATGYGLAQLRASATHNDWRSEEIFDFVFLVAVGAVVGGRLGYAVFYNLPFYATNPLKVFAIWDGGMSFHGGVLGVLAAVWRYAHTTQRSFLAVGDFLAPLVPLGLGFGRLGNFINQELWGRVTEQPWGMWFQSMPDAARHPSQLYQFALEGVALFCIVWLYSAKPRPAGRVSGLFLLGYGVFRFAVEFFREPDAHLGTLAFGWLTMGQLLSIPMILLGGFLLIRPQPR